MNNHELCRIADALPRPGGHPCQELQHCGSCGRTNASPFEGHYLLLREKGTKATGVVAIPLCTPFCLKTARARLGDAKKARQNWIAESDRS